MEDKKICKCKWDVYENLIKQDPDYGRVLSWVELTEQKGYTQVHRFGIPIKYCPVCGELFQQDT